MTLVTPSFSSPLAFINLGESMRELNEELIQDIEYHLEYDTISDSEVRRSFWGDDDYKARQTDTGLETDYTSFRTLQYFITRKVQEALREIGYIEDYVRWVSSRGFWANSTEGGISMPHIHMMVGKALFSGVYYPQGFEEENEDLDDFDKEKWIKYTQHGWNASGSLVIDSNNHHFESIGWGYDKTIVEKPEEYKSRIFVKPRQSLLVLFPATQPHYTLPHVGKRYSISFSTGVETKGE